MNVFLISGPLLALFATAAVAQTATSGDTEVFGTNWPLSIETTFFSDDDSLRADEDLNRGWESLTQSDRDMITADCTAFMATHGDDKSTGTTSTDASGSAGTGATATTGNTTGTESTTTGTDTSADAAGSTAGSGTDATTTATGYDLAQMKAICGAVEKF